jgi:hypothetical protein
MTPKKAALMVRLGDTYSALAVDRNRRAPNFLQKGLSSRTAKYAGEKCGSRVRFREPTPCRPCRHFAVIDAVKL